MKTLIEAILKFFTPNQVPTDKEVRDLENEFMDRAAKEGR